MRAILFLLVLLNCNLSFSQKSNCLIQLADHEASRFATVFSDIQLVTPANGLNIDVIHYKCFWFINPANDSIKGKVAIFFRPKDSTVRNVTLDLANNMKVTAVKFKNAAVGFSFTNPSTLLLEFGGQALLPGQADSLIIYYKGRPIASPFGSYTRVNHAGVPIIYTLSEPYGAKDWWPCKQALSDKADSVDFTIYTPTPNVAVSNGLQVQFNESNGIRAYRWKHKYPVATYLLAIAVTNYSHFRFKARLSTGDSLPIDNYSYPENLEQWKIGMAPIVPMIQYFDTLLTTYPFNKEKYGHAQFAFGGGMEHQTISFMQNTDLGLQAHELVHHWFGNKVTCGSWRDIWLNEGFATYLAADYYVKAGLSTWQQEGQQWIDLITEFPNGSVFCADTTNLYRIFSGRLSYGKGAMLLRMLKHQIGDVAFKAAIKNYLISPLHAYGYAKNEDLVGFLELASGQDLTEFFKDWYIGEGYPFFRVASVVNGYELKITLNQTSSHPSVNFFEIKRIPFKISGPGRDTTVHVNNVANNETFVFDLPFLATSVMFDPDRFLLAESSSTLTTSALGEVAFPDLSIFPNPSFGNFSLTGLNEDVNVRIFDFKGVEVYAFSSVGKLDRLKLEFLQAGLYSVKFSDKKGVAFRKLVILKD